jgi:kinesin family protein 3/17
MNSKETDRGSQNIVDIVEKEKSVAIRKEGDEDQGRNFTFDYVYGIESTQKQVYDESAYGLVESVLEGYNGTIFAYG